MRRLVLRPGAIGDCILGLPALEVLAADYTEVWISSPLVPLIRFAQKVRPLSSTGIDLVGVGGLAIPEDLRHYLTGFDSIVSWYGANRPEFRDALVGTGVACQFLSALPPPDYAGHASSFFADQVGCADSNPRVDAGASERRGTVVIHPFSGGKRKNWPLDLYRMLAAKLDCETEWLAGPEEELAGAMRIDNLLELAHWLKGASLYIGNDAGITHLAAAAGVPTLALFGPTDPARWAPRGDNVSVLREQPLEKLAVETVLAAASRLQGWR